MEPRYLVFPQDQIRVDAPFVGQLDGEVRMLRAVVDEAPVTPEVHDVVVQYGIGQGTQQRRGLRPHRQGRAFLQQLADLRCPAHLSKGHIRVEARRRQPARSHLTLDHRVRRPGLLHLVPVAEESGERVRGVRRFDGEHRPGQMEVGVEADAQSFLPAEHAQQVRAELPHLMVLPGEEPVEQVLALPGELGREQFGVRRVRGQIRRVGERVSSDGGAVAVHELMPYEEIAPGRTQPSGRPEDGGGGRGEVRMVDPSPWAALAGPEGRHVEP
ncbi:hypothetical protein ABZZ16_41215, partial [Streptomyces sp. NPDC006386]|uniref:hypothetical protein n=1 Tax=Streptomyces sp. NPDC006386 TaxID=3156762 RepID=UPI0033A072AD